MKYFLRNVFQNTQLAKLWFGQIISQSGDSIYQIGLLWLVLELTGSEAQTGLISMMSYLPSMLFALFAGVAADRYDKRKIMINADLLRVIFAAFIPIWGWLFGLSMLFLIINTFIVAISASFFNPARDAFIPTIVPTQGLMKANSLIQTSWQFSLLLGPAIAGGLLVVMGNVPLFWIVSLAYFLSMVCILLIKTDNSVDKRVKAPFQWGDLLIGLNYVKNDKVLLPLLLITIANNLFIMGPAIVGTPVLVKLDLGLDAEAYALVMGCYAVGMLLGTFLLFGYSNKVNKGRILLIGMFLDGITFLPLMWVQNLTQTAIVIIIHSLAIPMLTVSRASIIQAIVPSEMRGRVFALVNLSVVGMSAISAGLAGVFIQQFGARTVFFTIGIGGAVCGIFGYLIAKQLRNT